MNDAPSALWLLDTERWCTVRGLRFPHLPCLTTTLEEVVDRLHLISRQWPLPRHTVLRARHEINLVLYSLVLRKIRRNLIWEHILVLSQNIVEGSRFQRVPALPVEALLLRLRTESVLTLSDTRSVELPQLLRFALHPFEIRKDAYLFDAFIVQVLREAHPAHG
ncbi:hypothetical protein PC116_g6705 [Phytophthora cactorum]|nr:hypothetical protein PC116_g6705 [Phytophthora cactorum]